MKEISYTMRKIFTGTLIFLLLVIGISILGAKDSHLTTVTIDEFVQAWEKRPVGDQSVILDVRTPGEYKRGHALNSVNLDFFAKNFRQELDKLDKGKTYFMYCRSGNRSSRTLKMMKSLGFEKVYNLTGGWTRYHRILSTLDQ